MLEDRNDLRPPESDERRRRPGFRWTWTLTLVVAYVVVLLLQQRAGGNFYQQASLSKYFALSPEGLAHGYVWQLVTYQFMHGGWLHLILNSWIILVFGMELERLLGARRYLGLLFSAGIIGGVLQVITGILWPSLFGGDVVGASACAFGLIATFAMLFPEHELTLLIFLVIPLRLRARTLLIFSFVVALMGVLFPMPGMFPLGNVANAAHLGGMATGWFYVKHILKNSALPKLAESARRVSLTPDKPVEKEA